QVVGVLALPIGLAPTLERALQRAVRLNAWAAHGRLPIDASSRTVDGLSPSGGTPTPSVATSQVDLICRRIVPTGHLGERPWRHRIRDPRRIWSARPGGYVISPMAEGRGVQLARNDHAAASGLLREARQDPSRAAGAPAGADGGHGTRAPLPARTPHL